MKEISFSNKTFNSISSSYTILSTRYKKVTLRFEIGKGGLLSGFFIVRRQPKGKHV